MRSLMIPIIAVFLIAFTSPLLAESALDIDLPSKPVHGDDDIFNIGSGPAPEPRRRNPITDKYEDEVTSTTAQSLENEGDSDTSIFDIGPGVGPAPKTAPQHPVIDEPESKPMMAMPERPLLNIKLPVRGMTQASIKKLFGNPDSTTAPVGNPPISSWRYPLFTVFFEKEYVIHSVITDDVIKNGASNQ
jgi:hypothetical protein